MGLGEDECHKAQKVLLGRAAVVLSWGAYGVVEVKEELVMEVKMKVMSVWR